MRFLITLCLALCLSPAISATTYYVSGKGSDGADARSSKTAFRTLQHAADLTEPGDTVYAMDGTYSIPDGADAGAVLSITRAGTADKWIVYKALAGQTPKIVTRQWDGVLFGPTAAYVELNGFTVTGVAAGIDKQKAIARGDVGKPAPDPYYDGNCVAVDGRKGTAPVKSHHIRILNNVIGDCGGGGVATLQADYVTISGNTISGCSHYSIYGTSGISTLESWNSDDSTGYKMIITRNRVFDNAELVWWEAQGKITDGEAIIVDTLRSPTIGTYKGRTLVADNVIYDNGSAAIEVFRSDHVDVLNNSTYGNVTVPEETGRGELSINEATDIRILNNILVSAKGQNPLDLNPHEPCNCTFGANVYYGGENKPTKLLGVGDLFADPQYLNVDLSHLWTVDLRVAEKSPALNSGVEIFGSLLDFAGKPRTHGYGFDRGAFEQSTKTK